VTTALLITGWVLTILGFLWALREDRKAADHERQILLNRIQFPDRPVTLDIPKPPDLGPPEPEPIAGRIIREGDTITDADREALRSFGIEA
jgi:hypothetical protein